MAQLIVLATSTVVEVQWSPCFVVKGAGMEDVNGLYVARELSSYAGPMAYNKASTERTQLTTGHVGRTARTNARPATLPQGSGR